MALVHLTTLLESRHQDRPAPSIFNQQEVGKQANDYPTTRASHGVHKLWGLALRLG
jgi:hypothetical protein